MRQSRERLIRELHAGQIYGAIFEKPVVRNGRAEEETAPAGIETLQPRDQGGRIANCRLPTTD